MICLPEPEVAPRLNAGMLALARDEVHCWVIELDRPASEQHLSADEQARAARLRFDRDRLEFARGRAKVREILGRYLDDQPAEIAIAIGDNGRPYLLNHDLRFNYSRSEGLGVLAVSRASVLGVDIEAVRQRSDLAAVAEAFFSAAERDALDDLSGTAWTQGFYNCWTRKEAVVKALGAGLTAPLQAFDVALAPGSSPAILRVENTLPQLAGWSMQAFSPVNGYCAALVSNIPAPKLQIIHVEDQSLRRLFNK